MKEIQLSQGKVALVDDDDFEWLLKYKWHIFQGPTNKTCYAQTCIKKEGKWTTDYMHRLILKPPKGIESDHRNDNGLDNQRHNLRLCTKSQNQANKLLSRENCISRFIGVTRDKRRNKWMAQIRAQPYQSKFLGYFVSETDAALAYDQAAQKYHGDFARLNFAIPKP